MKDLKPQNWLELEQCMAGTCSIIHTVGMFMCSPGEKSAGDLVIDMLEACTTAVFSLHGPNDELSKDLFGSRA